MTPEFIIIFMRKITILLFALTLLFAGCKKAAETGNASATAKRFPIEGKVIAVDKAAKKATIDHKKVEGYMDAMTMDFPIHADWVWNELQPGAEIKAELVVDNTQPSLDMVMPVARIKGELMTDLPADLFIPPDALSIILDQFEGPLDLLLYLIRRHSLDILDIPMADLTRQYMTYVEAMREGQLELAAEYLLMAALLIEIKSRMLLPRPKNDTEEEGDPRAELVRRLQEYERYKKAAEDIEIMPRMEREWYPVVVEFERISANKELPDLTLEALLDAFRDVLHRGEMFADHRIKREALSVRERMSRVLAQARGDVFAAFHDFFSFEEGRAGAVVTLMAILELIKEAMIEIVQNGEREPIYVKLVA